MNETTALGFKYQNGIVLAVDSRVPLGQLIGKQKIFKGLMSSFIMQV